MLNYSLIDQKNHVNYNALVLTFFEINLMRENAAF